MLFDFSSEERTLAASPRRLAEARRNGHVPRSRELTSATAGLSAVAVLGLLGGDLWDATNGLVKTCWSAPTIRFTELELPHHIGSSLMRVLALLAAMLGSPAVAAATVAWLQAGFRSTLRSPTPQWSRISPASGWRGLCSGAGLVPFGSLILKFVGAGLIAGWMLRGDWTDFVYTEPESMASVIGGLLLRFGLLISTFGMVFAVGDWWYRRREFARRLRMTPAEAHAEMQDSTPRRRPRTWRRDRVSPLPAAVTPATEPQGSVSSAPTERRLSFDPASS